MYIVFITVISDYFSRFYSGSIHCFDLFFFYLISFSCLLEIDERPGKDICFLNYCNSWHRKIPRVTTSTFFPIHVEWRCRIKGVVWYTLIKVSKKLWKRSWGLFEICVFRKLKKIFGVTMLFKALLRPEVNFFAFLVV